MNEQVQQDAAEYGRHIKQGGWRLGLLVARNVVKAPGRISAETLAPKVNATTFAKMAKTTNDRVLRHLDAWEKAAEAGHVTAAADLKPGDEPKLDVAKLPDWTEFYTSVTGGFNGSSERVPSPAAISKALAQMEPEQREVVIHELVASEDFGKALKADPVLRDEVRIVAYQGYDPEEGTRKRLEKIPSSGITSVREFIDRAKYEVNRGVEMLVKMHINGRVDLEQDDTFGLLRGACADMGRAIFEFESALGQPLVSERIEELREKQEDYNH